jgi:hypothetical protein
MSKEKPISVFIAKSSGGSLQSVASATSVLERAVATRQLDQLKRDFVHALVARDAPPRRSATDKD